MCKNKASQKFVNFFDATGELIVREQPISDSRLGKDIGWAVWIYFYFIAQVADGNPEKMFGAFNAIRLVPNLF
jgi:hypothetical protein